MESSKNHSKYITNTSLLSLLANKYAHILTKKWTGNYCCVPSTYTLALLFTSFCLQSNGKIISIKFFELLQSLFTISQKVLRCLSANMPACTVTNPTSFNRCVSIHAYTGGKKKYTALLKFKKVLRLYLGKHTNFRKRHKSKLRSLLLVRLWYIQYH